VGAAGGEALALVTGRGQADLTGLEAHTPYVRDGDAVLASTSESSIRTSTPIRAWPPSSPTPW
jgi:arginase